MSPRPLSPWIAPVLALGRLGAVNLGDERADARTMPMFAGGWRRQAVPFLDDTALGLVNADTGEAVVELSETALPIPASEQAIRVLAEVEEGWPRSVPERGLWSALADEEALFRLLLVRWNAEGNPPDELFQLLPWQQVDRLADDVTRFLQGGMPGPLINLGHQFAGAGSRFTAALEQLDEGLREDHLGLRRLGSTDLCQRLLWIRTERLPYSTRGALSRLTIVLREHDRFLGHSADRVFERLGGADPVPTETPSLETELTPAASNPDGIRSEHLDFVRDPFELELHVTATARVQIKVRVSLLADDEELLSRGYGVMLLPVWILDAEGRTSYYIPLRRVGTTLSGLLDLPIPPADIVEADVAGPPIGVAEVGRLAPAEIERSIVHVRSNRIRAVWSGIAEELPSVHPLRQIIEQAVS
jgi:hypothetical protein